MRHILWVALAVIPLGAQQLPLTNSPAAPDGTPNFTSSSQLVIETAIVKDQSGNPIEGLTTITEDGKPPFIAFCEFQKLEESQETIPTFCTHPGAEAVKVDKVTRGHCHRACLLLGDQSFEWQDRDYAVFSWEVTIPITEVDRGILTRPFGASGQPNVVPALVDIRRKTLISKRPAFLHLSEACEMAVSHGD